MIKLSAVIITLNEEENIAACIDSVKDIADEVLVVDSYSADRTIQIAEAKGARVIHHKFEGHVQQKNFAKDHAAYDYVLSIDGDERLSDELRQAIKLAKENFQADGYSMSRLNFFRGKPIKTCGWYPDTKLRLWNRKRGGWTGTNPHDKFELEPKSTVIHLKGDLLHNTYPTYEALQNQTEKFATISAQHLKSRHTLHLMLKMIVSAPFKFIRNYFFKLGIIEGTDGLVICYYQSKEVFLKYYRALKLKYQ